MTTREEEIRSNAFRQGISYAEAEAEWDAREAFHRKIQNYISRAMNEMEAAA